jgi:hypothetical protein
MRGCKRIMSEPSISQKKINNLEGIVEITGISASGKSTLIKDELLLCESIQIFNSGSFVVKDKKTTLFHRILSEFKNISNLILFSNGLLNLSDVAWLFKASFTTNAKLGFKVRIFINCLLKFAYYITIQRHKRKGVVYVIDEGISHIPFLIQDQNDYPAVLEEFFNRFRMQLSMINVFYIDSENVNTVERLKNRGHKRLTNVRAEYIKEFDDKNRETMLYVIRKSDSFNSFGILN